MKLLVAEEEQKRHQQTERGSPTPCPRPADLQPHGRMQDSNVITPAYYHGSSGIATTGIIPTVLEMGHLCSWPGVTPWSAVDPKAHYLPFYRDLAPSRGLAHRAAVLSGWHDGNEEEQAADRPAGVAYLLVKSAMVPTGHFSFQPRRAAALSRKW